MNNALHCSSTTICVTSLSFNTMLSILVLLVAYATSIVRAESGVIHQLLDLLYLTLYRDARGLRIHRSDWSGSMIWICCILLGTTSSRVILQRPSENRSAAMVW